MTVHLHCVFLLWIPEIELKVLIYLIHRCLLVICANNWWAQNEQEANLTWWKQNKVPAFKVLMVWEMVGRRLVTFTCDMVGVISVTVGIGTRGHRGYQTDRRLKKDLRDREAFPWPKYAFVLAWQSVHVCYGNGHLCWSVSVCWEGMGGGENKGVSKLVICKRESMACWRIWKSTWKFCRWWGHKLGRSRYQRGRPGPSYAELYRACAGPQDSGPILHPLGYLLLSKGAMCLRSHFIYLLAFV